MGVFKNALEELVGAELLDPEGIVADFFILQKNILSTYTKTWGFQFHKSVPRGTFFFRNYCHFCVSLAYPRVWIFSGVHRDIHIH